MPSLRRTSSTISQIFADRAHRSPKSSSIRAICGSVDLLSRKASAQGKASGSGRRLDWREIGDDTESEGLGQGSHFKLPPRGLREARSSLTSHAYLDYVPRF